MNDDVGFFCKSYRKDFAHLHAMIESFSMRNPGGVQLTLSLPDGDIPAFINEFGSEVPGVRVVADESYCAHDLRQFRGWHGQQICKLMSWRTMTAEQYVCVDSDCYFIRDIDARELRPSSGRRFLVYGSYLRTVLKEGREDILRYIRGTLTLGHEMFPPPPTGVPCRIGHFIHYKDLDLDNPSAMQRSEIPIKVFGAQNWVFYQPGQTYSRGVLIRMQEFFQGQGLEIGDLISISPWENNWYGEFAASQCYNETEFRVSPFLHFQAGSDVEYARRQNITESQLSEHFMLVNMAAGHIADIKF
jgi:hypothetical protein